MKQETYMKLNNKDENKGKFQLYKKINHDFSGFTFYKEAL